MKPQAKRIAVAVRLRPALGAELGEETVWAVDTGEASVTDARTGDRWHFDHVFGPETDNSSLYSASCSDAVEAFCRGVNSAVLAYGQTAAGKTHTMYGPGGIVERSVETIFGAMDASADDRQFNLSASFLEVYNEQVSDLLGGHEVNILEGQRSGLVLQNLSRVPVTSSSEVLDCIARGERRRRVGETAANTRSSRSHVLLLLWLESHVEGEECMRCSQLILADLAGSEGLRHTDCSSREQRLEGSYINRSLLALTQVIQSLAEGGPRAQCTKFRDSKLTRILRPSLGGNAQTVLLCALAPGAASRHETRSSLDFAARAGHVENCVCVNLRHCPGKAESKATDPQCQALRREILELRRSLAEVRSLVGVGDLAESPAKGLKAEMLQVMHLACSNEDLLATMPGPCRRRRRVPATASPESRGATRDQVAGSSSSMLRQPGWRSRQLRGEEAFTARKELFPPGSPAKEVFPAPKEHIASPIPRRVAAWTLDSTGAEQPIRHRASNPSSSPVGRKPHVGSWEYPLTQAEKHARLIQLFTQELSCVHFEQEGPQPESSDDEQEEKARTTPAVNDCDLGTVSCKRPAADPEFTRSELWRLLKHEGCGLCAVQ